MSKKKILIFSYKLPFPLTQGGAIAQYYFLQQLVAYYDITFCTILNNEEKKNSLHKLQEKIPSLKISYIQREEKRRTTLERITKIIKKINKKVSAIFKIKQKHKSIKRRVDFSELIDEKAFNFITETFKKESYDLVQFDFYEALSLLPLVPKNIKKVVVHHEIRSKRNKLLNLKKSDYQGYFDNCNEIIENALLGSADAVVVFNEEDKMYLNSLKTSIHVSPFGIPNELIQKDKISSTFKRFLFIGGEFHYPNKEGLEWFLDTIYIPNIEKINWPIYIIGDWSKMIIDKYRAHSQKIVFCGFVPDLKAYYDESVMIVPILSGSGIRTKILTSLANKLPVIATPFACEGLLFDTELNNHVGLFTNESEFLNIFLNSFNDDFLTKQVNVGFDFYNNLFGISKLVSQRVGVIENVLKSTEV